MKEGNYMSSTNYEKNKRGLINRDALGYLIELSKKLGYISSITPDYKIGKPGFADKKQFKAHYLITFPDNTEWVIFTTTSIRDRVKEQYWESLNLKQLNPNIKRAYLVYPDSILPSEKRKGIRKNAKIESKAEYSTLEGIISQDRLFNLIEEYALSGKTPGQIRGIKGNNFETRLAAILENPWNLEKWKTNDPCIEGIHYDIFKSIVTCFNLDSSETSQIEATADKNEIGLLPSGGLPKTDVRVKVITAHNTDGDYYTISCKRSSDSSVSVHQYSADTFSRVLDPSNTELKELLNLFQRCGNKRDMGKDKANRLAELLKPHVERLSLWALGGYGGDGDPKTQWANYIITYDNLHGSTSVHVIKEYCRLLMQQSTGTFGTPFNWTYQGTRGTNIQLKCKILK